MAQRLQAYLHKNRVGTFTFRWRPPKAERDRFDRSIYVISLGTKDRTTAWHFAARMATKAHRLITLIRTMPKPKKDHELISIELIRSFTLTDGTTETVDYDPSNPVEVQEAGRVIAEIRDRQSQLAQVAPIQPPKARPSGDSSPTITVAFRQYCDEKRHAGAWKDPDTAERYDHGPVVELLIALVGNKRMAALSGEDIRAFRKSVLAESGALTNKNKKLQRLRAFLSWAVRENEYTSVSLAPLTAAKGKGKARHYEPFTNDELASLFHSKDYREQSFREANQYWIPLLGLYTGARINELAQLHVDDVLVRDGIPIIQIDDEDYKRTKTDASVRAIPIHSALLQAGLLEYLDCIRSEGWTRLFPELSWTAKSAYGKDPSSDFTEYRRACGVSPNHDRVKVFHSFRVTANSVLRFKGVPQERRERLVGHESGDTNNNAYRPADRDEMFAMSMLRDELEKLSFELAHPPYAPSAKHRTARLRAASRRKQRQVPESQDAIALSRAR